MSPIANISVSSADQPNRPGSSTGEDFASPSQHQSGDECTECALIRDVVHDLRSPLGAISVLGEVLLSNKENLSEAQRQNLSLIQEAAAKAQKITDDASELASLHSRTLSTDVEPVRLTDFISDCRELVQASFDTKGVYLKVQPVDTAAQILTDAEKGKIAVLRYLEEALACASPGDTVNITCIMTDALGELWVQLSEGKQSEKAAGRPCSPTSSRGRLGGRKPGESKYSLSTAGSILEYLGGSVTFNTSPDFHAILRFPLSPV